MLHAFLVVGTRVQEKPVLFHAAVPDIFIDVYVHIYIYLAQEERKGAFVEKIQIRQADQKQIKECPGMILV